LIEFAFYTFEDSFDTLFACNLPINRNSFVGSDIKLKWFGDVALIFNFAKDDFKKLEKGIFFVKAVINVNCFGATAKG
jgi:hypothetical protein